MPTITIPGFASQLYAWDETVQVTSGTLQTIASGRWYYFVSNRTTASNGQSFLYALKLLLEASLGGTTWTVVLTKVSGLYRVQLSHNNGSSRTVTFSANLATALGFSSASFAVANGVTVTASYPSYWWWTPNMPVSATGQKQFDPAISYGVPSSAGAMQLAPDMTAAYAQNGVQYEAEYVFNGVEGYHVIHPYTDHTNEDLETWWLNGPKRGRRFLMWRSRDSAVASNAPSGGSATPYNYIEYAPQEALRGTFPAAPLERGKLQHFDVKFAAWSTENGEAVLSV